MKKEGLNIELIKAFYNLFLKRRVGNLYSLKKK
jgi:hypothetical protein